MLNFENKLNKGLFIIKRVVYLSKKETKTLNIMKAIEIQKQMNNAYANRSYKKAYSLFLQMNIQREIEGIAKLTLPNLQAKFE